ncbi:ABC transporter ATP-binding protein [Pseudoflavonifractor sp. 60]|uniref:ABC transporter ATP-binding protein n=1 Tax=Pseudoflavonifractor sp. 60 TaxID=2304576 RepID=UPI001369F2CB|nr:ABC transporter ATP-binding protein [Pseudoflavonifractor sp. 60]NBI65314.1 ABC transporter ATP-binding protein [Pseudoflavonifractor sp. 60]
MAFLEIKDLQVDYATDEGVVHALNHVDLELHQGETLGLVGETGASKTTMAKCIMRLLPQRTGRIHSGKIIYQDQDLLQASDQEMRKIRGAHIAMIFQDPMTSLNPVLTVGEQIAEAVENHRHCSKAEAMRRAEEMLELVGIPAQRVGEYPHQFSGGMKQRVVIAIALACDPKLLIADEPTTALDVTIQAQVLEMMQALKEKLNTSMLLITHDLGVVAQNCDHVAVIYAGEIVEYGTVRDVFKRMSHPYTRGLFTSIPQVNADVKRLIPIPGMMPDPTQLPAGCKFCTRCQFADDRCRREHPGLYPVEGIHTARCFRLEKGGSLT